MLLLQHSRGGVPPSAVALLLLRRATSSREPPQVVGASLQRGESSQGTLHEGSMLPPAGPRGLRLRIVRVLLGRPSRGRREGRRPASFSEGLLSGNAGPEAQGAQGAVGARRDAPERGRGQRGRPGGARRIARPHCRQANGLAQAAGLERKEAGAPKTQAGETRRV